MRRPCRLGPMLVVVAVCAVQWGCAEPDAQPKPAPDSGARVDVAVVTVIAAEYEAMLAKMDRVFPVTVPEGRVNSFAWQGAEIDRADGRPPLRLIVALAGEAGTTSGALAVMATARTWQPTVLVLAGIAGGLPPHVEQGDVVISEAVWGYEYGAIGAEFAPRRDWVFQPDPRLLKAASDYTGAWQREISVPHPDDTGAPRHRVGITASGNKVIETLDSAYVERVLSRLPMTASVEMEAAGAFAAAELLSQDTRGPALLMLRGISDIPDPRSGMLGSKADRERWKRYAADTVAAFTKSFLRDALPDPAPVPSDTLSDVLIVTYSQEVCAAINTRMPATGAVLGTGLQRAELETGGLQPMVACLDDPSDRVALDEAVEATRPAAVLLVDTARGAGKATVGDVAVARLVVPVDHNTGQPVVRNTDGKRGARALVAAAQAASGMVSLGDKKARFGVIVATPAAGEWPASETVEAILAINPRTIAIDLESAMVISSLAAHDNRSQSPLFLSIQGVDSTFGNTDQDVTRAADNATAFLMALLEQAWPLPEYRKHKRHIPLRSVVPTG
jgi:nucleoside phosphorylase